MRPSTRVPVGLLGRRGPGFLGLLALLLVALLLAYPPGSVLASGGHGNADPLIPVLFLLALVLVMGKLGGDIAVRLRQPEVLGELMAGVVAGNLGLLGFHGLDFMKTDSALTLLAGIGVVLLLFEVGLESTVGDMLKVGGSSLLVATLGVIVPMALGLGVGAWLLPGQSGYAHVFLGAALCATSVGITARVLQDLGRSRELEARIILGAAVIDDVLGLLILAVVTGMIGAAATGETMSAGAIAGSIATAVGFVVGAIVLGRLVAPRLFRVASYLRARGVLPATALAVCFLLSALAGKMGLAPIVGAFAAGLLLEAVHFRAFGENGPRDLEEATKPVVALFAPFFFVQMGARVDLATFGQVEVLGLAAALTVAAVLGKQVCALGVLERGRNRLAVGLGMIPRGEVGLIFAQIGQSLILDGKSILSDAVFSAVVIMVVITTIVTPPLLKWGLERGQV